MRILATLLVCACVSGGRNDESEKKAVLPISFTIVVLSPCEVPGYKRVQARLTCQTKPIIINYLTLAAVHYYVRIPSVAYLGG